MILEMAIPSQLSLKTPLVFRMVNELVAHECLPPTGSPLAELAIDEALTNAMIHGNGLAAAKKVHVWLFADEERWGAIVEDEGSGFGPEDLPRIGDLEDILREQGRGVMLIDGYVDDLVYNAKGNRVMLIRRRQSEPEEAAAEPVAAAADAEEQLLGAEPFSVTREDDVAIVDIFDRRLSHDNLGQARTVLAEATESSHAVVLDMRRVGYISSPGIGLLASVCKRLGKKNGFLILAGVQPVVRDILSSMQLQKLLTFADDRAQAVSLAKQRLAEAE
jgi:serine/threonine-protein kinase RsbW